MRHYLLFVLARRVHDSPSHEKFTVPYYYPGENLQHAYRSFLDDHTRMAMAEFIEPLLWVTQGRYEYSSRIILAIGKKYREITARRQRRDQWGNYLPDEEHAQVFEMRWRLAMQIAPAVHSLVSKELERLQSTQ